MAGLDNIYSALAKEKESNMQTGLDYSKIREGGVAAAVMAQAGGMLGGAAMQAAGYQTPAQIKQQARNEVKAMFPNPQTRSEMIAMANAFKNLGQMDDYEKIMKLADDMAGGTEMKKWQAEIAGHTQAIADYAKSKGYTLTDRQLANLVSSTKAKGYFSEKTGTVVSGWVDIVNQALAGMKPDEVKQEPVGDVNLSPSTPTDLTKRADDEYRTNTLGKGVDDFRAETNKLSESLGFNTAGLLLVDELDAGQSASLPPLKKALSTLIGDDRISMMEIQQATKIGDIGQRMTDWFTEFATGDLSPETKSQIRSLFRTLGKYEEQKYNSKVNEYKKRYSQFTDDELNSWFPPRETSAFYSPKEWELIQVKKAIRQKKGGK